MHSFPVFLLERIQIMFQKLRKGLSQRIYLTDIVITPIAVKDKLKQLNNCKAQGPDGIPPRVLKEVSENLAIPLSILFNTSLEKGLIPADWKQAEVVAVY